VSAHIIFYSKNEGKEIVKSGSANNKIYEVSHKPKPHIYTYSLPGLPATMPFLPFQCSLITGQQILSQLCTGAGNGQLSGMPGIAVGEHLLSDLVSDVDGFFII
jgi:hypothetical protein